MTALPARLLAPDACLEIVAEGCTFTEGPIWHPVERYLLFSDMPADVRRRWSPDSGVTEIRRPSNKGNGMTYDAALDLIICEHTTSMLVREGKDGSRHVLASHFEGVELNSPNDVCVGSSGWIYFTDPWYGRMPVYGVERPRMLGWQGVFRVPSQGGEPELLVPRDLFTMPNGLCFSPDERRLYINDTEQANVRVFDVRDDGRLGPPRLFADGLRSIEQAGVPDGMKCDVEGNVWVTGPGGVHVFDPKGEPLGRLDVPELVANLHWGEEDWRTLFLCATDKVYRIQSAVSGRIEPFMRTEG